MKKALLLIIAFFVVISAYPVLAPIWYGSGDNTGLVGHWKCEKTERIINLNWLIFTKNG